MKQTAQMYSHKGRTFLPTAKLLLPPLEALYGSLPGNSSPHRDESAQGWNARARRLVQKGGA